MPDVGAGGDEEGLAGCDGVEADGAFGGVDRGGVAVFLGRGGGEVAEAFVGLSAGGWC